MKYNSIPKIKFKKGTSKKKRKMIEKVSRGVFIKTKAKVEQLAVDNIVFGTTDMKLCWDVLEGVE